MSLIKSRFKGKIHLRGRPNEQATAEIRLMKAKEAYEARKRRRNFFTILDIIAIIALICSIYSFYFGKISRGFLFLLVSILILGYFLLRNYLRNKNRGK